MIRALAVVVPPSSRLWIAAAALGIVASLTLTGWAPGWIVLAAASLVLVARRTPGPALAIGAVVAGSLLNPMVPLPVGDPVGEVTLVSDPVAGAYGHWAEAAVGESDVIVDLPGPVGRAGDTLEVVGVVADQTLTLGGRPRQVVEISEASVSVAARDAYTTLGLAVRDHVVASLSGGSEARGLLAGFLVGDVSSVGEVTNDEMRRAGLSHFVAVSGSNVALFLGLVALCSLPFGVGPKRRALACLLALPVFVIATGFEPSVIRAAVMAALVLSGRLIDVTLETWQVVSLAAVLVVSFDPWLVRSAGLQLSLAATCGVVAGSRWPGPSTWAGRALCVSVGAQLAVAPLLLANFGTMPLLSPVANLVAGPLVAAATVLAMAGVAGLGPALVPAEWLAGMVIEVARFSSGWPQVGWLGGTAAVLGLAGALGMGRRHRPMALGALLFAVVIVAMPHHTALEAGEVAVLDVGQGDAILISGGGGLFALVDGGSDPALLLRRLEEHGVGRLALVVMTHGDADHAGGLAGLPGRVGIGYIWERSSPHSQAASDAVIAAALRYQVPIREPRPGDELGLGLIEIEVLGPSRRFASANDQSIVLRLAGPARTMLLTGDIESFGQEALGVVRADVLKVPHHGAATSDAEWLASIGASEAVVSVGPNDFGHPVPWVLEVLESSGAIVRRTDIEGTVIVDLSS